jgi:hypothetical protein
MTFQKYPIGHQDFQKIISEGFVYVDKTPFAFKLAERGVIIFSLALVDLENRCF